MVTALHAAYERSLTAINGLQLLFLAFCMELTGRKFRSASLAMVGQICVDAKRSLPHGYAARGRNFCQIDVFCYIHHQKLGLKEKPNEISHAGSNWSLRF